MKNKILATYPKSSFESKRSKMFYVVDFTERTKNLPLKRGVEFLDNLPQDPKDPTRNMHFLTIANPKGISVDCNIFDDCQFVDDKGSLLKHGECCFFPTKNDGRSWIGIVEIKDCKPNNISNYNKEIKEKMEQMFHIFREKVGIPNSIFFIVSFPRRKTAFDDFIFTDYIKLKKFRKFQPLVTNNVIINGTHDINFKM